VICYIEVPFKAGLTVLYYSLSSIDDQDTHTIRFLDEYTYIITIATLMYYCTIY